MDRAKARGVTETLGRLDGEAAQMKIGTRREAFPVPAEARALEPIAAAAVGTSYYGLPLVKEPVWVGAVPLYFWVGGAAGAAATLSSALRLFGGPALQPLAKRARWLAAIGDSVGAGLLIYDLGRPTRFFNMMRVFNPRSPMSVGSWVLASSGAANLSAALLQRRRGFPGAVGELAALAGGMLGMPLAGYTAVLLSNSAVPVWSAARRTLPLAFMASSVATAGALLSLTAGSDGERRTADRFAAIGQVGELVAIGALHREVSKESVRVARPLTRGASGWLLAAATALTAASLVSSLSPRRSTRRRRNAALLGAAGSLALRFAIHYAGKASARDPHATIDPQRRRIDRSR